MEILINLDARLATIIYDFFSNSNITQLFNFITNYTLGSVFAPLLILLVLIYQKKFRMTIFFILSYGSLIILRHIILILLARSRPFIFFENYPYLGSNIPDGFSFPSGHATSAFFLTYFIAYVFKLNHNQQAILYFFAGLVALSRVYLGAHYPLDVAAGGLLGVSWGYASFRLYSQVKSRHG